MSGGARADRSWPSLEVLVEAVSAGRTRAAEQVERAFERIEALDRGPDGLNAFVAVDADAARTAAAAVDDRAAADRGGQIGSLAGVPVAVKDNLCTLGLPTTCGSRVLEGYRSPYEATVVRRLRDAGAVVVGKTNMDEFAMGSSTESSAYGPTRNPHDPTRVPGGSSGGSAAAVAAGLVPAALGSSTGGSVRQPAAFCGIVGLKPTYGRVSRYGLVAFASSLDQVGTFGRTVADAARLLAAIEGPDRFDSTAAPRARRPAADWIDRGLEGLVVGVPEDYFPRELDDAVAAACRAAIDRLRAAGALIRELALPHTRYAIPAYYVLAPAEASSNLARYDGVRFGARAGDADATREVYEATRERGFGDEVKRRIMLGTYALSAGYYARYYARAQRVRRRITEEFARAFAGTDGVDVIFTPTAPSAAFEIGERVDDPLRMYLADAFTVTANLAGLPGLSLPVGNADGLPIGGQLLADRWDEATLVRAAAGLERALAGAGP